MQFLREVQQKAATLVAENATTLLTAGGVVGTVATGVLAGRAGFKAGMIIREAQAELRVDTDNDDADLTKIDKVKMVWPHFLPPVLAGSFTITSIIMANRMSAQKAAALAAAYGLAERNLSEYKEKVAEKLTGPKAQQIDDELAQDRVERTSGHETIIVTGDEVLCFDEPTGRYFRNTMEGIRRAVNSTNAEILNHGHANASYFYEELGLDQTTWTEDVGWNSDHTMDVKVSAVKKKDKPCLAIDFTVLPKLDYRSNQF